MLPPPLELVTYRDYAFWNIVVCEIRAMRPRPLPGVVGLRYRHAAYRFYVRFRPRQGDPIEGLYFLRSDCNSPLITATGNIITNFNFHTAPIHLRQRGDTTLIQIDAPDAPGYASLRPSVVPQLPAHSAFDTLEQAQTFLKYKPAGIAVSNDGSTNVVHITRDESAWHSRVIHVETAQWAFLQDQPVKPEICYQVEPIPYQWNRGKVYR
jgi:hypothetical protein